MPPGPQIDTGSAGGESTSESETETTPDDTDESTSGSQTTGGGHIPGAPSRSRRLRRDATSDPMREQTEPDDEPAGGGDSSTPTDQLGGMPVDAGAQPGDRSSTGTSSPAVGSTGPQPRRESPSGGAAETQQSAAGSSNGGGLSEEQKSQAIGKYILNNSDRVTTGADDPTPGPYSRDDITVRKVDGEWVVGPSEGAVRRVSRQRAGEGRSLGTTGTPTLANTRVPGAAGNTIVAANRETAKNLRGAAQRHSDTVEKEQALQLQDNARTGEQEQFGDIDWSFGFGGPGDEVESAIDDAGDTVSEKSQALGKWAFNEDTIGESAGHAILEAAGRDQMAEKYDRTVRNFGQGLVHGAGELANIPGLIGTGMEGAELAVHGASETAAGRGGEAFGDVKQGSVEVATGFLDQATENPANTAGLLTGGLVGSYGAFRAARAVGPRTSAATRAAIQPGEEALGTAGYGVTKALRGTKAAERAFPGKEPLIFSEEAALRAGRGAANRLGEASPTRASRRLVSGARERTPSARLVKDPESPTVSVDSELAREIGQTARRARDAVTERVTPSGSRTGTAELRAGADLRPESALTRTPGTGGTDEAVGGLVRGAQRPSVEGAVASGLGRAKSGVEDAAGRLSRGGPEGVAPLVQGAQRPSVEGAVASGLGRTREAAGSAASRALEVGRTGTGASPEGVSPLIAGAQRPSLEGGASRAYNLLAFEGRRRRLQGQQTVSEIPNRISEARRSYPLALQSDVQEVASGLDTRARQTRSRVRDTDLPSRPSVSGMGKRFSGLSDYTLRIGPSPRYWESGGTASAPRDSGSFGGLDVEGFLGDVDNPRTIEAETDADTTPDVSDTDAGDGLVALESKSRARPEPLDTSRTGTGTDVTGRARELPVSRSLASAFEPSVTADIDGPGARESPIDRLKSAQRPTVDVGFRGPEAEVRSPVDLETESRTDIDTETGFSTETETRTEFETKTELELEFETELEPEPRKELEQLGDRPRRRGSGNPFGGRTASATRLKRDLLNPFTGE